MWSSNGKTQTSVHKSIEHKTTIFLLNSQFRFDKYVLLFTLRLHSWVNFFFKSWTCKNTVIHFRKKIDIKQANKSCVYCFWLKCDYSITSDSLKSSIWLLRCLTVQQYVTYITHIMVYKQFNKFICIIPAT